MAATHIIRPATAKVFGRLNKPTAHRKTATHHTAHTIQE